MVGVISPQSACQILGAEKLKVLMHHKHLSLSVQMGLGAISVATGDNSESIILNNLKLPYLSGTCVRKPNRTAIVDKGPNHG